MRKQSKKEFRKTVKILIVILLFCILGSSCQNTANTSTPDSSAVKLTIWIGNKDSYIGPYEIKKSPENWYISKAFKRFEAQNPGIKVLLTVLPDQGEAHNTFKVAGLAQNAPDIANLWSGQYIFSLKDVIMPLDGKIPNEDYENLLGWETVRENFKKDGKILGYPASDIQLGCFIYNKKIIAEAGLDFENNPPRNRLEFDDALGKIKEKGYTPIASDESFPYFLAYIGNYWWVQNTGIETIMGNCTGKTKFIDDQGFLETLAYYNDLYKKGYINQDAAISADSWNQFLQGKAAMIPNISSVVNDAVNFMGEDMVGVIRPLDMGNIKYSSNTTIGGPGQCLVVSKSSQNADLAIKLISFLSSKAEMLEFDKVLSKIPLRKDITLEDLGWSTDSISAKLFGWGKNYTFFVDNSLTTAVFEDWSINAALVLVGKITPEEMAAVLDNKVKSTLGTSK